MTIHFATRFVACFPLILSCGFLGVGCSEDEQEETVVEASDCEAIGDVCTHDVSGSLATECHELAHSNDTVECAARKHECVDFCSGARGEGGAAGSHD